MIICWRTANGAGLQLGFDKKTFNQKERLKIKTYGLFIRFCMRRYFRRHRNLNQTAEKQEDKRMKKIIALIIAASVLAISASAATPLYKPVKIPTIKITVPRYDFSFAVEQYLKEHPVT